MGNPVDEAGLLSGSRTTVFREATRSLFSKRTLGAVGWKGLAWKGTSAQWLSSDDRDLTGGGQGNGEGDGRSDLGTTVQ